MQLDEGSKAGARGVILENTMYLTSQCKLAEKAIIINPALLKYYKYEV